MYGTRCIAIHLPRDEEWSRTSPMETFVQVTGIHSDAILNQNPIWLLFSTGKIDQESA
jgi:hypothetical protein